MVLIRIDVGNHLPGSTRRRGVVADGDADAVGDCIERLLTPVVVGVVVAYDLSRLLLRCYQRDEDQRRFRNPMNLAFGIARSG